MDKLKIELTDEFISALDQLESTKKNIFITGKAGTGKSTLLRHFMESTGKNVAVLAPTGVAAVNIGGQTFHSFFGFRPDINKEIAVMTAGKVGKKGRDLLVNLDMIIIDEISMLRADLLDYADAYLRTVCKYDAPFGGKQMVFFGDLYQLPPVVTSSEKEIFSTLYSTPYFFSSESFECLDMEIIELDRIFRQTDSDFTKILNSIRNNTVTDEELAILNSRTDLLYSHEFSDFSVVLTSRNDQAAAINGEMLDSLGGKSRNFEGTVIGNFDCKNLPTEINLELKIDSQVMLLNNDPAGRWVNGSIGVVKAFSKNTDALTVELINGTCLDVFPFEWDLYSYIYNETSRSVVPEISGSFIQYPLKLAWALTIHKSQGKTFDRMVLDIGRGAFSPGQVYVALSRVRTLDGLILKKPLKKSHIFMDRAVVNFMTEYRYRKSRILLPLKERRTFLEEAIKQGCRVEIEYLKSSDIKSRRIIRPCSIGKLIYNGKTFEGITAFCEERGSNRCFRLDRILSMKKV